MSARKRTALHDKWHPRVEGQIRDVIYQHPEWFCLPNKVVQFWFINSLAKRIVGEIVADARLATMPVGVEVCCPFPGSKGDVRVMLPSGGGVGGPTDAAPCCSESKAMGGE